MRVARTSLIVLLSSAIVLGCADRTLAGPGKRKKNKNRTNDQTEQVESNTGRSAGDSAIVVGGAQPRVGLHATGGNVQLITGTNVQFIRRIVQWGGVEKSPGKYNIAEADRLIREYGNGGIQVVPTLRSNAPAFVRNEIGDDREGGGFSESAYPKDMNQWLRYVSAMVERYDGDGQKDMPGLRVPIKYWQIENEWLHQWKDTDESFQEFFRRTAETIREADPEAKIIGPGFTNVHRFALADDIDPRQSLPDGSPLADTQKEYTKSQARSARDRRGGAYQRALSFLRQSAKHADILDIHLYTTGPDDVRYSMEWLRRAMRDAGVQMPVWSLEYAMPFYGFSDQRYNELMAAGLAVGFAEGLERLFLSHLIAVPNQHFSHLILVDKQTNRPTTAYYNFAQTVKAIDGFASVKSQSQGDIEQYTFQMPDGSEVVIAWNESGGSRSHRIRADGPVTVYPMIEVGRKGATSGEREQPSGDAIEVELTQEPVIVVIPSSSVADASDADESAPVADSSDGGEEAPTRIFANGIQVEVVSMGILTDSSTGATLVEPAPTTDATSARVVKKGKKNKKAKKARKSKKSKKNKKGKKKSSRS
ncbi:MAG: hypothetical protein ACF8PN_11135 [Phycisphaerales bacterium]